MPSVGTRNSASRISGSSTTDPFNSNQFRTRRENRQFADTLPFDQFGQNGLVPTDDTEHLEPSRVYEVKPAIHPTSWGIALSLHDVS